MSDPHPSETPYLHVRPPRKTVGVGGTAKEPLAEIRGNRAGLLALRDLVDRVLMGRKTYEMIWTIVRDRPVEGADRMNELPKVVFSRTLEKPLEWNNSRLVGGDLVGEVRSLKAEGGEPLRTMGSLSVVKRLLEVGLVDRLRLVVFPQILGETGREPLFAGYPDIDLELVDTDVLDDRLVTLEYRPATARAAGNDAR